MDLMVLDRPFTTHNAELLAMVGAALDAELKTHTGAQPLNTQVKQALKRSLAGKRPTLQGIASEVGMSTRSLQRKLSEAGITFQHVVEETRREPACRQAGWRITT